MNNISITIYTYMYHITLCKDNYHDYGRLCISNRCIVFFGFYMEIEQDLDLFVFNILYW